MKSIRSFKLKSAFALLGLAALGGANLARAQLSYLVDINTSSIVNHASGPFFLDFQSLYGSGSPQTITLSNFSFTGGSLLAGTDASFGAVNGSLATSLVLSPSSGSFFNEFFQQFAPTVSDIKFKVDVTTNPSGVTPTSFSVSILDKNLFNIPTTGVGDSLLLFNLNAGRTTNFQTATGLGVTLAVVPVPEPATYGLMAGAILLAGVVFQRRTQRCAA